MLTVPLLNRTEAVLVFFTFHGATAGVGRAPTPLRSSPGGFGFASPTGPWPETHLLGFALVLNPSNGH